VIEVAALPSAQPPPPRRQRRADPPGAGNIGERLRVIDVSIAIDWHVPNPKMRRRGNQTMPREDKAAHRVFRFTFTHDVFESRAGLARFAKEIAERLWGALVLEFMRETLSLPRNPDEERRPGA
jgi:hypothetical protein